MFYKKITPDTETIDLYIYLVDDDFKPGRIDYINFSDYIPKYAYIKLCDVINNELNPDAVPNENFNATQIKFTYPLFNRKLETLTKVFTADTVYMSAISALRALGEQVFNDFTNEIQLMNAWDYELYKAHMYPNAFERAFCDGQVHIRIKSTPEKPPTLMLLYPDFTDERICVSATNSGPQPLHQTDERIRFERDKLINETRLRCYTDNKNEFTKMLNSLKIYP